jgi:hypothetical protein
MKLSAVLQAQRQSIPGMRLHDLIEKRHRLELNKLWCHAHAAEAAAKQRFLDELVWVVSQTRPVLRASESSGYFTITFESGAPPHQSFRNAELTVHIGPEQGHHYNGCFVQVRRDGRHWTGMAHRRMQISPNETALQIWARVRHYFLPDSALCHLPLPTAQAA